MAGKPKGGRGKKAPYHTKLMRVPEPIAAQVDALGLRYQEFIAAGGDSANPPFFLVERIQKQSDAVKQKPTRTASDKLIEKTSPEFVEIEKLSKEQRLWKELNRRQQIYLRLIFEIDQHREALKRGEDGRRSGSRSASQWRWIEYGEIFGNSTTLRMRIKEAGEVDPGTGSTFKMLSMCKLIEIRYPYDDLRWLDCKLTKQGRAVVIAGLRLEAPKKASNVAFGAAARKGRNTLYVEEVPEKQHLKLTKLPMTLGKLELTIKINELPNNVETNKDNWKTFELDCDGRVVSVTVKPKIWKKLEDAVANYPQWVAAIGGKMGESTSNGFVLSEPSIQVFEKKPKEPKPEVGQ
jgi:hypothetical protein